MGVASAVEADLVSGLREGEQVGVDGVGGWWARRNVISLCGFEAEVGDEDPFAVDFAAAVDGVLGVVEAVAGQVA
jgi:hypothetical protein